VLKTIVTDYLLNFKVKRSRVRRLTHRLCSEVAARLLNDQEWERLTQDWYAKRQWPSEFYASDSIFEWEKNALSLFPKPPSNLLVLAAGRGREVRALIKMGYSVFGIEMDRECLTLIEETCQFDKLLGVMRASFLDIATGREKLPKIPFEGVIIGWGALVNLPSKAVIVELLRLIAESYQKVPILLSGSMAYRPRPLSNYLPWNRSSTINDSVDFYRWFDQGYGPCGHLKEDVLEGIFRSFGYEILYRNSKDEYPHWIVR
jgi:hypothetical protein